MSAYQHAELTKSKSLSIKSFLQQFHTSDWISGFVAGVAQIASGHPFDTIKVKLQAGLGGNVSTTKLFVDIFKTEGLFGLYRGALSPLVGACILNGLEFGVYNECKELLRADGEDIHNMPIKKIAIAGALSGISATFITLPVEYLKCNLQIQSNANQRFRGPYDLMKHMYKLQMVGSNSIFDRFTNFCKFYKSINKGFLITCVRESGIAIHFTVYEIMKKLLKHYDPNTSNNTNVKSWHSLVSGAAAGCAFWTIMYPIDIIKSRIQINPKPMSILQAVHEIYKPNRKLSSFYMGYNSAIARAIV
ncbi:hypothetical protein ABK040_011630 [Willaertia magna]